MFKRILSMLLIAALVVFVSSAVTNAVTGRFGIHISLMPQTTAQEKVPFEVDLQFGLDLKFTVSGLTFSNQLMFGVAGMEHAVFDLEANLGALTIRDDFVFATPFWCANAQLEGYLGGYTGYCGFDPVIPYGPLLFVKKRVTAEISIGGITLTNLAMFEDVNFSEHPTYYGYELGALLVSVGAVPRAIDKTSDGKYDQLDQKFRFGDILTVKGETPSGIRITSITAFNAYPQGYNCVKKKCWAGTVVEQAVPTDVGQTTSEELRQKLFFYEEKIYVENIKIGPLTLAIYMRFLPTGGAVGVLTGPSFRLDLNASFDLPPIGKIVIRTRSEQITAPLPISLSLRYYTAAPTITLYTAVGTLGLYLDEHFNLRELDTLIKFKLDPAPATFEALLVHEWAAKTIRQCRAADGTVTNYGVPSGATEPPACPANTTEISYGRELVSLGWTYAVFTTEIDLGGGSSLTISSCFGGTIVWTQNTLLCTSKEGQSGTVTWQFTQFTLATKVGSLDFVANAFMRISGLHHTDIFITLSF